MREFQRYSQLTLVTPNRESQYRQYLARLEENAYLANQTDWLQNFPVRAMIKMGWIQDCGDDLQQLRELLRFFGVASPEQWEAIWGQCSVTFRKTAAFQSECRAIAAWLRKGEIEAQNIDCQPYNAKEFHQYLINKIRPLTLEPPEIFQPELERLCAFVGVTVVFVPQLPKARVSGATRWLTSTKALIQLSLRYKTDDHLWFTFFHEAGHILLHGKREVFLESDDMDNAQEEANKFAADTLIPPTKLTKFLAQKKSAHISKESVIDFAAKIGVAPGIVVGRLQHDGYLPFTHCNGLKRTFEWAD